MCGENLPSANPNLTTKGSPPRVRGKPSCVCAVLAALGITPACAGKTSTKKPGIVDKEDHPRVCGENNRSRNQLGTIKGSPPRVRGKRRHLASHGGGDRITPACAGKTCPAFSCVNLFGDHPRVCGENGKAEKNQSPQIGSPPRVRGKRKRYRCFNRYGGITPACAGKTALGDINCLSC